MSVGICEKCGKEVDLTREYAVDRPRRALYHTACAPANCAIYGASDLSKDTTGKPKLSWTMRSMMEAIAAVREYGNKKYKTNAPNNWEKVDPKEWHEALLRHAAEITEAMRNNDLARLYDKESGILHLAHMAVSIMFQIELAYRTGKADWLYQPNAIVNKEEQK